LAAPALDYLALLLRHHLADGVRNPAHLLLGDHDALPLGHQLAVVFADHLASGVRHHFHALLPDEVALAAGDHLAVVLADHLASGVRHLLRHRIRDVFAHSVVDCVAVLFRYIVAAANLTDFFPRHPGPLAGPVTGALHFLSDHRAGTVMRRAGAWVK